MDHHLDFILRPNFVSLELHFVKFTHLLYLTFTSKNNSKLIIPLFCVMKKFRTVSKLFNRYEFA